MQITRKGEMFANKRVLHMFIFFAVLNGIVQSSLKPINFISLCFTNFNVFFLFQFLFNVREKNNFSIFSNLQVQSIWMSTPLITNSSWDKGKRAIFHFFSTFVSFSFSIITRIKETFFCHYLFVVAALTWKK